MLVIYYVNFHFAMFHEHFNALIQRCNYKHISSYSNTCISKTYICWCLHFQFSWTNKTTQISALQI